MGHFREGVAHFRKEVVHFWEEVAHLRKEVGPGSSWKLAEIKQLLATTNQRFLDNKMMVERDPNFGHRSPVPPTVQMTRKYDGHDDNVEDVEWISDPEFVSCSLDKEL